MSELLNLIGLSTGVVLYLMLLAMVLRDGRTPPARFDPLLLTTALLGGSRLSRYGNRENLTSDFRL